jgi:hypothetical protein
MQTPEDEESVSETTRPDLSRQSSAVQVISTSRVLIRNILLFEKNSFGFLFSVVLLLLVIYVLKIMNIYNKNFVSIQRQ